MKKVVSVLFLGCAVNLAFADAPVVDYSSDAVSGMAKSFAVKPEERIDSAPVTSKANLSAEQRVGKLEQQINNINSQNLTSKIEELQQRLQKINGQFEDQAHQIELLNTQIKSFYQDLNQRLETGKSMAVPAPALSAPPTPPSSSTTPSSSAQHSSSDALQNGAIVPATTSNLTEILPAAAPVNPDSAFLKEQQMYQTAIDLLPDKKYEASESKLREYLKMYPKGVYVANAHYWLGEINFLQKNFDAAEEEFKIVVEKYSKAKRVSDATLKLALVHQNQGRKAETVKEELKQLIKRYPGTSAAQLAKQQLAGV